MKHVIAIACLAVVFQISSCQGQDEKQKGKEKPAVNPQTNISVNKEYDESGNLIRYDSTYSYYYSNIEGLETVFLIVSETILTKAISFQNRPFFLISFLKILYCFMIFIKMTFLPIAFIATWNVWIVFLGEWIP